MHAVSIHLCVVSILWLRYSDVQMRGQKECVGTESRSDDESPNSIGLLSGDITRGLTTYKTIH